jgi:alpha-glucosidase
VNQTEIADSVGRDPERTPSQWDDGPNAGFTPDSVTPWLPLAADYHVRNVARQEQDPAAMLSLFGALAPLRRAEPSLHVDGYAPVEAGVDDVFSYTRSAPYADSILVVLNLGADAHILNLSQVAPHATVTGAPGVCWPWVQML